jgi:protein-S-isoprenylcysteine O-methyltransferase Ste14
VNPWFGKAAFLFQLVAITIIRTPHGRRVGRLRVVHSRKGRLEVMLLALMWIATTILPLLSIFTPLLSFADHALHPAAFAGGLVSLTAGLWLLHRSHADLGSNWSISLEIREHHQLVSHGVYARIRHPMYTALFLQALAQGLLLPNWLAGPAYFVGFLLMFSLRVTGEERMMLERFGDEYRAYCGRTNRLIPGIW